MPASRIGPYTFISMSRCPSSPNQRLSTETRAGVNGTAIWRVGTGGQPFQVRTVADALTFGAAVTLFRSYETLIGSGALPIIYGGESMPYLVAVLSVEPDDVAATAIGVGGLLGTSTGIVRATWTLQPWRI